MNEVKQEVNSIQLLCFSCIETSSIYWMFICLDKPFQDYERIASYRTGNAKNLIAT